MSETEHQAARECLKRMTPSLVLLVNSVQTEIDKQVIDYSMLIKIYQDLNSLSFAMIQAIDPNYEDPYLAIINKASV